MQNFSPMIHIIHTVRNDNPGTIWNVLAARLGREPTEAEARDEVLRILDEARAERLGAYPPFNHQG